VQTGLCLKLCTAGQVSWPSGSLPYEASERLRSLVFVLDDSFFQRTASRMQPPLRLTSCLTPRAGGRASEPTELARSVAERQALNFGRRPDKNGIPLWRECGYRRNPTFQPLLAFSSNFFGDRDASFTAPAAKARARFGQVGTQDIIRSSRDKDCC
jgi:hypothetical protein